MRLPRPVASPIHDCRIRFDYHPKSGRAPRIFENYEDSLQLNGTGSQGSQVHTLPDNSSAPPPWHPFPTRPDFEFAEFVTRWKLPAPAIDELIRNVASSWSNGSHITMESAAEVTDYLTASIPDLTKVRSVKASVRLLLTLFFFSFRRKSFTRNIVLRTEESLRKIIESMSGRFPNGLRAYSKTRTSFNTSGFTLSGRLGYAEMTRRSLWMNRLAARIGGTLR